MNFGWHHVRLEKLLAVVLVICKGLFWSVPHPTQALIENRSVGRFHFEPEKIIELPLSDI
jgi:hypothetical protein